MTELRVCLTDADLQALIDGTMPEEQERSTGEHLETCEGCRQRLDSLAGQSHVIPPEIGSASDPASGSEALAAAMRELKVDTGDPGETLVEEGGGPPSLQFLSPSANPRHLGRLGGYEILEVIGRGGMGTVLKARDAKLERLVAVKVLNPDLAASGQARQRAGPPAVPSRSPVGGGRDPRARGHDPRRRRYRRGAVSGDGVHRRRLAGGPHPA